MSLRWSSILGSFVLAAFVSTSGRAIAAPDLIVTPLAVPGAENEVLKSTDASLPHEGMSFLYNPDDFPGARDKSGTKSELLASLEHEMKQPQNPSVLYIPRAPQKAEHLQALHELSEEQLQVFLGKKQLFLEKMVQIFRFFHLKVPFVNKVLREINNRFYDSSHLIAKSNAQGGTFMISVQTGLALPQKFMRVLQKRRLARFIPQSGGFSYLFGLGFGLTRQNFGHGNARWVLEAFADLESLKSSLTGNLSLGVNGTLGVVYELRENDFKRQNFESAYGSITGAFRRGENQFGWSASTGLGFPPFIGAAQIYTNKTQRHYLFRIDLTGLKERTFEKTKSVILSWMRDIGLKRPAPLCAQIFP